MMLRFLNPSHPSILHYSHLPPPRCSLSIPHSRSRGGGKRFLPFPSPSSSSSFTTKTPLPNNEPAPKTTRILTRLNKRLPKFLHSYTNPLITAPISHITSFLILHELTALVPLVALFGVFHYTSWLPDGFGQAVWAREKAEKLVRYLERRKLDWRRRLPKKEADEGEGEGVESVGNLSRAGRMGERISRVLLEYVSSYKSSFFLVLLFFVLEVLFVYSSPPRSPSPAPSPTHQIKNSINQNLFDALRKRHFNTYMQYRTNYKKIFAKKKKKASHFLRNRKAAAPSQNHLMRMGYALVRKELHYPPHHFYQIHLLFQAFAAGTAALKFLLVLVSSKSFRTSTN